MSDLKRIEKIVRNTFFKQVLQELDEEKRSGVHVTGLVYDCLRRCYYELSIESREITGLDESTTLTFWIGKKLHEIELTDMHEFEVEWNGVKGRIDEVFVIGNEYVIVDKKTARSLPNQVYDNHKKQIEYYSALLWKAKGINARYGAVLYIDVNSKKTKVFVFELPTHKDKILEEMIAKKDKVMKAIEEKKAPSQVLTWLCDYCGWWERCVRDGV